MSDEPVRKQIEGTCEEVTERNGWTTFAVNVGQQYPIRLSTKLPVLIKQARDVGKQKAVWTFKESQGKENPNKPGTYYMDRYLDGVEVGGVLDTTESVAGNRPAGSTPAEAERQSVTPTEAERQKSIVRQSCLKVAATLVAATGTSDGDVGSETISLAARFETWVRRDIDDPPFQ